MITNPTSGWHTQHTTGHKKALSFCSASSATSPPWVPANAVTMLSYLLSRLLTLPLFSEEAQATAELCTNPSKPTWLSSSNSLARWGNQDQPGPHREVTASEGYPVTAVRTGALPLTTVTPRAAGAVTNPGCPGMDATSPRQHTRALGCDCPAPPSHRHTHTLSTQELAFMQLKTQTKYPVSGIRHSWRCNYAQNSTKEIITGPSANCLHYSCPKRDRCGVMKHPHTLQH